jgi:DNA-binding SARP family transcriptional activator
LRVWDGAAWSAIQAAQQRVVLSILLIETGRPVSTDRLVDELWPDKPPRAAGAVIRGYVMRLRRALAIGTEGPLVTGDAGYRLEIDGDDIDARRFDRLVGDARRDIVGGDPKSALVGLADALALWQGPALADVPATPTVTAYATHLEHVRLAATEDYIDTQLDLGRYQDPVDDLQALVDEHPLRERLWGQLMRALYRAGRRGEALAVYQRARAALAAELGLEPGPQLRKLQQVILSDDDSEPVERPEASRPPLACLPPDQPAFAGRRADLDHLASLVDSPAGGAARPLILLTGAAGIGKTTLAIHWAHRIADGFPDGQLFVNLRGFDPTGAAMSPAEAIRVLLEALEVPPQDIPVGLDAQIGRYRSLLTARRMLIVLDNAQHSGQVRPLLPGTPGSLVVVTSRNQLAGLVAADGARPVRLDVLPDAEARHVLDRRLGTGRLAAEPDAVDEILDRCGGLPLALTIVAARAAIHPRFALRDLAVELRAGLDGFAAGDDAADVRAVLSWSYEALAPDVARLFRLLAVHPGPEVAVSAAASVAGRPLQQVRTMLGELARAHLLDEPAPGRYAFHDLLRAYAAELADTVDSEAERHAALRRMLDHYLYTAHAAARLLERDRDPIDLLPPEPGVTVESVADHRHALVWFARERPVLIGAAAQAARAGLDRHAWQLPWTLASFLDLNGHWHDQVAVQATARDAAARLGHRQPQVRAVNSMARAYVRLGRLDDADVHFRQAATLADGLGDDPVRAHTRINIGSLLATQGRYREALPSYQQAMELYEALGHQGGQARTLCSMAWCHATLGDHRRAYDHALRALALAESVGDPGLKGGVWDTIGFTHVGRGQHRSAVTCYERALPLLRDGGDRYREAETLTRLGDSRQAIGEPDAAQSAWRRALDILMALRHPDASDVRRRLLA